ncbi:MAG: sulfotransferase, partial [Planctomycetes bacterium]|nr:sulfotransferase [Planctomycetota bacterium]
HSEEKEQLPEDFFAALQPGSAAEIFIQLLERLRIHASSTAGIVGIKEIWCEEFIAALALLPRIEIKSLLIIRDPRAVFASRNTGRYLTSCEGKRYPLRFISQTWLRSCCLAHHLSREKKCLVLRYEDLVQEPGRTCDEICAYLGIPMDSVMLAPEQWLDGNGKPWQPNTTGSTGNSGFNQKPLTYWQQALTKAEIGAIEHLCGSEMEAQGYARATTIIEAEQLAGEYTEDPKQLQPWLAQQGYLWDSGQHVEFTQEKPHEG